MNYLNHKELRKLSRNKFRRQKPIRGEAYHKLLDNLPDIALFETRFGNARHYGQKGHNRYSLEYSNQLNIAPCWHEFVQELQSNRYRKLLRNLLGVRPMKLSFHWHYTPDSCAVHPHCDSRTKLGSHIFYLNTSEDWQTEWGGQTLVLNDKGRINCKSAPEFEVFDETISTSCIGNNSLILKRTPHSWHGVKPIACPEDKLRKVFIVVITRVKPFSAIKKLFIKSA